MRVEVPVLRQDREVVERELVTNAVDHENGDVGGSWLRNDLGESARFSARIGERVNHANAVVEFDALRFPSRRKGIAADHGAFKWKGHRQRFGRLGAVGGAESQRRLEVGDGRIVSAGRVFERLDLEAVAVIEDASARAIPESRDKLRATLA